jgi:fibronectin type 3 domain-containing protein
MTIKVKLSILAAVAFMLSCTKQDAQQSRVNPFDAGGSNWTLDSPPVIALTPNPTPLWSDFNFTDSTGSIFCKASITDNNGKYDTLDAAFLIGTSSAPTDTSRSAVDSGFCPNNLKPATKYYFSVVAKDKRDSLSAASGSFTTPSGFPPRMTDSLQLTIGYSSISLMWYNLNYSATYKIYRSTSPSGPFMLLADTVVSSWNSYGSYTDYYVNYNQLYYYKLSASNTYGESKSKKLLFGYISNSRASAPYDFYASQGSYANYIYLNWYSYTPTGTVFILRSLSSSGPFQIIDSVTNKSYYYDSLNNAPAASAPYYYYYYKIFVRDQQGNYSPMSSYTYGYPTILSAPSYFSASQGSYYSYIALSWQSYSTVTGYYIYRCSSASVSPPQESYQCIDTVFTGSSSSSYFYYNDSSVTTTANCYYEVAAFSSNKKPGPRSSYTTGYLQRPTPPTINATKGTYLDCIVISWSQNISAKKYYIYRSYTSNYTDSFKLIDSTALRGYVDSVQLTGNYYYTLTTVDVNGRTSGRSTADYGYLGTLSAPSPVLASSNYSNYISLSWLSVTGAVGYYIYRSAASSGPFIVIDSTTTIAYKDSVFPSDPQNIGDRKFYYTVQSYSKSGKTSQQSSYSTGILVGFQCPTNLTATPINTKLSILLNWDPVIGATGYCIYRASSYSGPFVKIGYPTGTSFSDTTATVGNYYYYTVSSLKGNGESAQSSYIYSEIPPLPSLVSSFTATGNGAGISLSWSTSASNVTGYTIYRSVDSAKTYVMALSGYFSSAFDSVASGQLIYYKIAAYNTSGQGPLSLPVSGRRLAPATPTSFAFTTPGPNYIALMWSTSYGATGYMIYRALSPTAQFTQLAQSVGNTFEDTQVQSGTVYYYKVAAFNPVGESAPSTYINFTAP